MGLIFIQKRRKKRVKFLFLYLKLNTTLQIGTSTYIVTSFVFTLIHSIFPGSECEHTNRLFISAQFRSFLLSGKTEKRLSEFLQKCTDSGTENTHLAGYNILVFKYVKISTGLPLLFIHYHYFRQFAKKAQNQILHNLAIFTSNVLNNKRFRQMKRARLRKNVIL